jgi:hypothetical protein
MSEATCMGQCGTMMSPPGMCADCVASARILNRNAIGHARHSALLDASAACESFAAEAMTGEVLAVDGILARHIQNTGRECARRIRNLISDEWKEERQELPPNCCPGCGRPGTTASSIPEGQVALHWIVRGLPVCIDCRSK